MNSVFNLLNAVLDDKGAAFSENICWREFTLLLIYICVILAVTHSDTSPEELLLFVM